MRVLISGASGLIGLALTRALRASGDEPVALVRRPAREGEVQWSPNEPLDPAKLAGCDAIVHLAGKNIAGHWTQKFKQEVRDSRACSFRHRRSATTATAATNSSPRTVPPARDTWPMSVRSGRPRRISRAKPACAW